MKKVRLYSYERGEIVETVTYMSPPLEALTRACGKWDQHGCWQLKSLQNILDIIQGFQETIFETIEANREVTNEHWNNTLAFHKVFMTAFLNNESVYLEFTE